MNKKTKIVATVSDRRCDVDFIRSLYEAGMNAVRINTAHASLEGAEEVVKNVRQVSDKIMSGDLIICQDFNSFARAGDAGEKVAACSAGKILIDHHLDPDRSCFDLCFSETEVSSTAELLYNILMSLPEIGHDARKLPLDTATALMTGMTTDTNNFANSVFPGTLTMASELLAAGVDRDMILENTFNSYKESRIHLMGYLLDRCIRITPDGVAYMILKKTAIRKFSVQDGDTEAWETMVNTNILGLLYCTRLLLPGMLARGRGHVVNVGSVAGSRAFPTGNVYGASKAFVRHLSDNMRSDLLGTPIRVTCLAPGRTRTEFSLVHNAGDAALAEKEYATGRPLDAEDIARALWWVVQCPPHMDVSFMEIMPTGQADGGPRFADVTF